MWITRSTSLRLTLMVLAIAFSLASLSEPLVSYAGTLTATPTSMTCPPVQEQSYDVVRISKDGKYLLSGLSVFEGSLLSSSEVRLWSIDTGKLVFVLKDPSIERFSVLDISPDTAYLLIGPSDDGDHSTVATLWSTSTGTKLRTINFKDQVNYQDENSRFSPDGKYILTTDYSGSYLWDTQGIQYRSFSLADAENPEGTLAARFFTRWQIFIYGK